MYTGVLIRSASGVNSQTVHPTVFEKIYLVKNGRRENAENSFQVSNSTTRGHKTKNNKKQGLIRNIRNQLTSTIDLLIFFFYLVFFLIHLNINKGQDRMNI